MDLVKVGGGWPEPATEGRGESSRLECAQILPVKVKRFQTKPKMQCSLDKAFRCFVADCPVNSKVYSLGVLTVYRLLSSGSCTNYLKL